MLLITHIQKEKRIAKMFRKILQIILFLSLIILVSNNAFSNLLEQKLDGSTLEVLLKRGELILLEEEDGKLKYIYYAIIIDAPLDKVWQVITDFESYPNFVQGHKIGRITKKHGYETIVASAVEFKFMGISSTVTYTTKYILKKPELIIFDTEKNRVTGSFKLIPIDEGERVVLFCTKEAKDVKNFGWVAKLLISQKPEMEFPLQVSPLLIYIKAIKDQAESSNK